MSTRPSAGGGRHHHRRSAAGLVRRVLISVDRHLGDRGGAQRRQCRRAKHLPRDADCHGRDDGPRCRLFASRLQSRRSHGLAGSDTPRPARSFSRPAGGRGALSGAKPEVLADRLAVGQPPGGPSILFTLCFLLRGRGAAGCPTSTVAGHALCHLSVGHALQRAAAAGQWAGSARIGDRLSLSLRKQWLWSRELPARSTRIWA